MKNLIYTIVAGVAAGAILKKMSGQPVLSAAQWSQQQGSQSAGYMGTDYQQWARAQGGQV